MHRQRSPGIVLVLPIDENPYQESLYGPMRAAHPDELTTVYWRRRPWIGLPGFFLLAAWCAARGARLAHIHWVLFDIHLDMPGRKSLSMITSRAAIGWLKLLRYRVIWTIHNITPHEAQTHDDLGLARELASTASKLIVHSPAVKQMLSERSISTERVVIIPQGSYLDAYQAPPSQSEARARLGLDQSRPMVLFFGLIRDYKGVLDAAIRVVGGDDTAKPYTTAEMYAIRSAAHEMYLVQQKKIALSAYDNKKALLKSGLDYMAYGHYRMPEVMAGHL